MRVLVVGAGAIGQVFGHRLQAGGADLAFLVRPAYAADARKGFDVFPLNRGARTRHEAVRLEGFAVFEDQELAMSERWDWVVLAVSSVALRAGDWFDRLAARLCDAKLLVLQPSTVDRDRVLGLVPKERAVFGMLSVISFQAPLPGEDRPGPGVAYWILPPAGIGFSGGEAAVAEITAVLRRGGMRLSVLEDVHVEMAYMGAVLDKVVIALECAGWSFDRLKSDPELLPLAYRSMQECWAMARKTTGKDGPVVVSLVRPFLLRWLLTLAPYVLPLDLERFFRFHYTKVKEQTLMLVREQLGKMAAAGVESPATTELATRLSAARGST